MPTSLHLLPFGPSHEFSHTVLGPVEPTPELEDALVRLQREQGRDVPLSFNTYLCGGEYGTCYGNTQEDAFGRPLKHVSIQALMKQSAPNGLTYEFIPPAIVESWNAEAAWSYLNFLPDKWRVALFWR